MFLLKYIKALAMRPRLMVSIFCGVLAYFFLPESVLSRQIMRVIVSWDIGISVYLVLAFHMMYKSNHARIADRALNEVEGQGFILLFSVMAVVISLFSIVMELSAIKGLQGALRLEHVLVVMATILLSWFFIHLTFSLHYAHSYYDKVFHKKPAGLIFPGSEMPDYFDFLYFSCIIGTSGQTADIAFSSRDMRRTGTIHCVLAYFFNAAILALTINIASGLI